MISTEDKREEKEQNQHLHQIIFFKAFQVSFGRRKIKRRKDQNLLGNSLLELIVIFQVLNFVFPIFCKHLADHNYP